MEIENKKIIITILLITMFYNYLFCFILVFSAAFSIHHAFHLFAWCWDVVHVSVLQGKTGLLALFIFDSFFIFVNFCFQNPSDPSETPNYHWWTTTSNRTSFRPGEDVSVRVTVANEQMYEVLVNNADEYTFRFGSESSLLANECDPSEEHGNWSMPIWTVDYIVVRKFYVKL